MSRITKIKIENFMSIKSAELEFDNSNIISICGYNDSGKSAITRSLEVILYNSYSADQNKFIKDGEDYFQITLSFDDGVEISKAKHFTGQSVWIMKENDDVLYTNQLENGIASVSDVPQVIENYFGVLKDPHTNQKLNVRRNTDKLFLIETTGGDNYKILNSILRADILARASINFNKDRNLKQSELTYKHYKLSHYNTEIRKLDIVEDHAIDKLSENIKKLSDSNIRVEYMSDLISSKAKIDDFSVWDNLDYVDTKRFDDLQSIIKLKESMNIELYNEVEQVDTRKYVAIEELAKLRNSLVVDIIPQTPLVDMDRLNKLTQLCESYNNWGNAYNNLQVVEQELTQTKSTLDTLSVQMGLKLCKNCGSLTD